MGEPVTQSFCKLQSETTRKAIEAQSEVIEKQGDILDKIHDAMDTMGRPERNKVIINP